MKKSSLLVLAFSFVAFSGIVSDAQAGKPTKIQSHCNKACTGSTDSTCKSSCLAQCRQNCPPQKNQTAYNACLDGGCQPAAPVDPTTPAAPADAPAAS